MPRRRLTEAQKVQIQTQLTRMRMLLRHPAFLKDLSQLRKQYNEVGDYADELSNLSRTFLERWRLIWLPKALLWGKDAPDKMTFPQLENLIVNEMKAWMPSPDPVAGYLFRPAIAARDVGQDYYDQTGEPHPTLGQGEVLEVRIDLSYPVDVLVSLVEEEIRRVNKRHKRLLEAVHKRKGIENPKVKRQRLDKANFYIKVFDLAQEGRTFPEIGKVFSRPVSTVKSAFLSIRRSIFELGPNAKTAEGGSGPPPPGKKEVVITNFDPDSHTVTCAVCKNAATFEAMCNKSRAYALQDYGSLRERLLS